MNITTLKQLKDLKQCKVVKTITKGKTIEDVPDMIKHCDKILADNEGASYTNDGEVIEFNNGQFILLPKQKKISKGILKFRSKDYTFTDTDTGGTSYGPAVTKANIELTATGFIMGSGTNYVIEYTIIEGV